MSRWRRPGLRITGAIGAAMIAITLGGWLYAREQFLLWMALGGGGGLVWAASGCGASELAGPDEIIHQTMRLKIIMSVLNALPPGEGLEFKRLKSVANATDGNLGAHLATLEGRLCRNREGLRGQGREPG